LIFAARFRVSGQACNPGVAPGSRFPDFQPGRCGQWSGCRGECPEPGEDLTEQAVAGRQPQGELPGVADEPAGDADQPPAQGGDHGFAAAGPVTGQDGLAAGSGGELVQPSGYAGGEQR
jgi:hypothetical protein